MGGECRRCLELGRGRVGARFWRVQGSCDLRGTPRESGRPPRPRRALREGARAGGPAWAGTGARLRAQGPWSAPRPGASPCARPRAASKAPGYRPPCCRRKGQDSSCLVWVVALLLAGGRAAGRVAALVVLEETGFPAKPWRHVLCPSAGCCLRRGSGVHSSRRAGCRAAWLAAFSACW